MTSQEKTKIFEATFDRLEKKYGLLMNLEEVAEALKYPTTDALRKALTRKTLVLQTTKLPNRRGIFIKTNEVAAYLDNPG